MKQAFILLFILFYGNLIGFNEDDYSNSETHSE